MTRLQRVLANRRPAAGTGTSDAPFSIMANHDDRTRISYPYSWERGLCSCYRARAASVYGKPGREHPGGSRVLLVGSRCHGEVSFGEGSRYGPPSRKRAPTLG